MINKREKSTSLHEIEEKFSFKKELFDWLGILVCTTIIMVILFNFAFKVVTIDGGSMKNTLYHGERVIISDSFYEPAYGDIVVISRNIDNTANSSSQLPIIKRIIATEGQVVDINFNLGEVFVDGVKLDEPYTATATNEKFDIKFPVVVPEGHVFVLGDNRNNSKDSRSSAIGNNGMVDERYILGKALIRILPLNRFGGLYNE